MATFTPPTRDEPIGNRLGQYGVAFPVGKVVYILDADDSVVETENFVDGTGDGNTLDLMKAGSGDFGKALFRRGKTYTITAGEGTILTNAGYTVT
jgi:hypothetical protein